MTDCLILCRSLTYAQRFTRCLEQCGLSGRVVRTPGALTKNGCGYAVNVPHCLLRECVGCLRKKGYHPGKIMLSEDNQYREWTP